jgi:hypothetical protein
MGQLAVHAAPTWTLNPLCVYHRWANSHPLTPTSVHGPPPSHVHGPPYPGNNERCSIRTLQSVLLSVTTFNVQSSSGCGNTACTCDYMGLGGARFCGTTGPTNIRLAANTPLVWSTNTNTVRAGFTICTTAAATTALFQIDEATPTRACYLTNSGTCFTDGPGNCESVASC